MKVIEYTNKEKLNFYEAKDNKNEEIFFILKKDNISDIKKAIFNILENTNINEIKEDNNEKKVFIINKEINSHLFSTISDEFSIKEKKEIIKRLITEYLNLETKIIILFKKDKIAIIKTNLQNDINQKYNGFEEQDVNFLISESLGDNFDIKILIDSIIEKIDFKSMKLNELIEFITNKYKGYIFTQLIFNLNKKYNIDIQLSKAIVGKLLRDNFQYAKDSVLKKFIEDILIKECGIDFKSIDKQIINKIRNKYLNITDKKVNISDIKNMYKSYTNVLGNIIKENLENTYSDRINLRNSETILGNIFLKYNNNNKSNIIHKLSHMIVDYLVLNLDKSGNTIINIASIFREILDDEDIIKVSFLNIGIDKYKLINELKKYITNIKAQQKTINKLYKQIELLNKEKSNTNKIKIEIENLINELRHINLGIKTLRINDIQKNEINTEIFNLRMDILNIDKQIKELKKGILSSLNNEKIKKLENEKENKIKKLENYKKAFKLLSDILKLKKDLAKAINIENTIKKLENQIGKSNLEIKEFENRINEIKRILTEKLSKLIT